MSKLRISPLRAKTAKKIRELAATGMPIHLIEATVDLPEAEKNELKEDGLYFVHVLKGRADLHCKVIETVIETGIASASGIKHILGLINQENVREELKEHITEAVKQYNIRLK